MMNTPRERWGEGDTYEHFMGRWSLEVAGHFLDWLRPAPYQQWMDMGCGTGALTKAIAAFTQPQSVVGLDPSFDFARYADQQSIQACFMVADGQSLPVRDKAFDVVVSGLALNFIDQPERALAEMRRIVKTAGLVAAYVWDYAGKMEFLRYFWDAALELDASAVSSHEGHRFPICRPESLLQLWHGAGFHDVSVIAIDISTIFDSFGSYWRSFTLGNFPAPQYVAALAPALRSRLREHLGTRVPIADDGSIHLTARVWAVRGYST